MRVPSQQASTPSSAPRSAAAVLSPALARTPAFRALFPQLRLLGRVMKDLRPQTPRWPLPVTPRAHGPRQGDGGVDGFSAVCGRGIPVRINGCGPQPQPPPLRLAPWHGSPLKPWCGTTQKPWVRLPHIFGPLLKLGRICQQAMDCGGTRGKGIPIRIS